MGKVVSRGGLRSKGKRKTREKYERGSAESSVEEIGLTIRRKRSVAVFQRGGSEPYRHDEGQSYLSLICDVKDVATSISLRERFEEREAGTDR
jgi:hypothetical protein